MKQKIIAVAFLLGLLIGGALVFFVMRPQPSGIQISEPITPDRPDSNVNQDLQDAETIPDADSMDPDSVGPDGATQNSDSI